MCFLILLEFHHTNANEGKLNAQSRAQDSNSPDTLPAKVSDFDGNGFSDLAVCLPGPLNIWYVRFNPSTACPNPNCQIYFHGTSADTLVPGDYTNNLSTNFVVYQPPGTFNIGIDSPPVIPPPVPTLLTVNWGIAGDIPLYGDYIGGPDADYVVVRPTGGVLYWYILDGSSSVQVVFVFGSDTDALVPGDYDGDGKTDITVWRPGNGTWYWRSSSTGIVNAKQWGFTGDVPLLGNFDANAGLGNTVDDFAVYRPSNGYFYILNSGALPPFTFQLWQFLPTDIPVPADYDNDNDADMAVFQPTTDGWHIFPNSIPEILGLPGPDEIPIPATYVKCLPQTTVNKLCP
jgi:hypothetical protein